MQQNRGRALALFASLDDATDAEATPGFDIDAAQDHFKALVRKPKSQLDLVAETDILIQDSSIHSELTLPEQRCSSLAYVRFSNSRNMACVFNAGNVHLQRRGWLVANWKRQATSAFRNRLPRFPMADPTRGSSGSPRGGLASSIGSEPPSVARRAVHYDAGR